MLKMQKEGDVLFFVFAPEEELLFFRKKCWKKKQNNSYEQQSADNVKSFQRAYVYGHQKKLFLVFRKQSGQRNQNNCNQNQSPSDVKSFQWSDIDSHLPTPFTNRMLTNKDVLLKESPNINMLKSNLLCKENNGRTIEAKITSDKLAVNSDSLLNWESFNDRFIANDDTMDRLVESRVEEQETIPIYEMKYLSKNDENYTKGSSYAPRSAELRRINPLKFCEEGSKK